MTSFLKRPFIAGVRSTNDDNKRNSPRSKQQHNRTKSLKEPGSGEKKGLFGRRRRSRAGSQEIDASALPKNEKKKVIGVGRGESEKRTPTPTVIDVKPVDDPPVPTSLGLGVTLWLHKFVKTTKTNSSGCKYKEVDVDVKVFRNDIDAELAKRQETGEENAGATLASRPNSKTAGPYQAKSFVEGRFLQRQGSWSHLRTKLVNAKVNDAFQTAKFDVKGVTYTSLSSIGEGGYSTVYEVYNSERELYALKVVKVRDASMMLWEDLLKEVQFLAKLSDCKHVVRMIEFDEVQYEESDEATLYVLMERGECDLSYILSQECFKVRGRRTKGFSS